MSEADQISSSWSQSSHEPSVTEVRRAALLAWEDYLTSVKRMVIKNMDLGMEQMQSYAMSLQTNLNTLIKIKQRMSNKTNSIIGR